MATPAKKRAQSEKKLTTKYEALLDLDNFIKTFSVNKFTLCTIRVNIG